MGNFISYELLPIVFNMSVTASVAILFVLLARLLLKRAPKIFSYALWAVVLFRLLCPVSITTGFSLLGLFDAPVTETTIHTTAVEYIPQDIVHTPAPEVKLPVPGVNQSVNEALPQGDEQTAADPLKVPVALATLVWLAGIGVLAAYSVVSLLRLRRKLIGALPLRDNIYLADYIDSPFVMGIFRPKIYLPSSLSEQERGYIILHERHHIRRGDHIMKALAFLALCVHWFNPLVWVAFLLSAKDMEMSCDEAVVKKLGEGIRADYSASLLSLATGRRIIAGTPLAFGEGDTKSRIKNLLNWKKPRTWIILTALVVCLAAIVICATNPRKDSVEDNMIAWEVDAEYPEAVVDIVNDYVMQQVEHYNNLGSGDMALGGEYSILQAKVIGLASMEPAPYDETHIVGLYLLQYRLLPSEPSHVVIAGGMQMDGDWITEWGSTGQPYLGIMCEENGAEDVWTLVGVTNTDSIQLDYNTEEMVTRYGSKYIAAAMELCNAYLNAQTQNQYATAANASYYLELAAGETFRNMNLDRQISLLVEYEDLLDDYTLISRETEDGKTAYIVGQYAGNPNASPLYGMYSVDLSRGEEWEQFLYREEASAEVEEVLSGNKKDMPPSAGYRITDSKISWSSDSGLILIQPKDTELSLDVAWSRYLYTPNGREYIADAVSRGIDVCGRTDTFLYVYRISERFGEIAERIALTKAEAAAILAEDRVKITEGFGFSASLHIDDQTTYFNEREGIPQTVLNLAVDRCDYRFGDPSNITDTIREARLDCDWLDTPLYARGEDLSRLREILKNAEQGYVGACGYGAKLTLTFSGGEMLTVFKGCDGCDTVVFGSYGGYFIGDKENSEFWEMFGLDPVTKAPIEANSNGRELLYKDEEILITVPEKYAHLVKMDGLYSDEQYTNKANFYYEPEYFEHRGYAAPLNGGWMLTISTTLPSFAENTWAGHNSTYWTKDGTRVYVEQRPTDSFNCTEANLAEFKAVMNSIRVEYIGLEPFAVGISLPTEQLSAAEHSAAVDAIFTNLKTGWWNGEALKSCVHESAAFECLYRKADANISRLYGYGGYFRWGRDETCVEYWYAPTIVTLDTDTQQVLDLWWPGDGAAYESSILNQFPEAIASTVAEPNSGRYAAVRARLMEASKEFMVDSSPLSVPGATRRFGVQDLRLEITNVLSTHKTSVLAEGIELHEYVVVSCTPESKITVLDAGMSDPSYSEDGKPHPKWGLSYTNKSDRTRITDETKTVPVTADLEGIYNLEASLFVIRLNLVD